MKSTLACKIIGDGEPILFLHGLGLNKESMNYIYEPSFSSSSKFKRIYVDLPGMGNSQLNSINN